MTAMGELRCIVVDDEEGAHLVLNHYIEKMKLLTLSGSFYSAIEAMDYMYRQDVDLIFLDINMPGLNGLEMLESMSKRPLVILTTAYKEFALEGYKYEVIDYLVKPFDFKKFLSAMDKTFKRKGISKELTSSPDYLMIKVDGDLVRVSFDSIRYLQSHGNYVKFFTNQGMYVSLITTSELEEKLDKSLFIRIHKSYIIAKNAVSRISGGRVFMDDNTVLPVGNTYKKMLQEYF
jgi:DNA-binding LytR/AlgR family response regulator